MAREICEHLDWRNALGQLKEMACRKALGALERLGKIILPEARQTKPVICQTPESPPACPQVTGNFSDIGPIKVLPISGGTEESRTWNARMDAYHPLGSGPLCGAQIRYLIVSEIWGIVGCLAVSAAAWRMSARDEWLDWQERYGYSPQLMETCVDASLQGTVYRAANWIEVGMTAGRGRQDISGKNNLPEKRVFLYPLCQRKMKQICGNHQEQPEPGWVHREFGGAELGDRRLERRLLGLAASFFARPMASIPDACGSLASTKVAYRFFDHDRTTMEGMIRR